MAEASRPRKSAVRQAVRVSRGQRGQPVVAGCCVDAVAVFMCRITIDAHWNHFDAGAIAIALPLR